MKKGIYFFWFILIISAMGIAAGLYYYQQNIAEYYNVYVMVDNAMGLKKDSRVYLNLQDIGYVDSLTIESGKVSIKCNIETKYKIPAVAIVKIKPNNNKLAVTFQYTAANTQINSYLSDGDLVRGFVVKNFKGQILEEPDNTIW